MTCEGTRGEGEEGRARLGQRPIERERRTEREEDAQVEDLDARRGRGAEPVAVGREDERVDVVAGLERVEVLALVEVPEHRDAVLAARRAERAVRRDGDGRDVAGVAEVVGLELALGELPDLRARRDEGGRRRGQRDVNLESGCSSESVCVCRRRRGCRDQRSWWINWCSHRRR